MLSHDSFEKKKNYTNEWHRKKRFASIGNGRTKFQITNCTHKRKKSDLPTRHGNYANLWNK